MSTIHNNIIRTHQNVLTTVTATLEIFQELLIWISFQCRLSTHPSAISSSVSKLFILTKQHLCTKSYHRFDGRLWRCYDCRVRKISIDSPKKFPWKSVHFRACLLHLINLQIQDELRKCCIRGTVLRYLANALTHSLSLASKMKHTFLSSEKTLIKKLYNTHNAR